MVQKQLISIVVPVYNEARHMHELYDAVVEAIGRTVFDFELILINDGSTDQSSRLMRQLSGRDGRVKPVELSRNFGKEVALTAGLHHAAGDAVVMMDADLEHPPSLLPEFLARWQAGADVVVGVRKSDQYRPVKKICSKAFNRLLKSISSIDMVPGATDFRLLDRMVLDEFNRFTERNRLARGLIDWLGFNRDYLYFDAGKRAGNPSYNFFKLTKLAVNSVVSLSLFPMKVAGYLGVFIMLISIPLGSFIVVDRYILDDQFGFSFSGTAILASIMLFLIGIVLISLGLIALYIANIHEEVVNRPLYVVRKRP